MKLVLKNLSRATLSIFRLTIRPGEEVTVYIPDEVYTGQVVDVYQKEVKLWEDIKTLRNKGYLSVVAYPELGTGELQLTQGRIFVGDVANVAREVVVSGDATLSPAGVLTLSPAVRAYSANRSYSRTSSGVQTLLGPISSGRVVIIVVRVTENFADNGGAQTVFKIGETGDDDKFAGSSAFVDATEGTILTFAGVLSQNAALIVTATPAQDDGTGAIEVSAIAVPVS